jgi:hypothetical protein
MSSFDIPDEEGESSMGWKDWDLHFRFIFAAQKYSLFPA